MSTAYGEWLERHDHPLLKLVVTCGEEMSKTEKEKDDEWLERPDHPLLNDLILAKVFKHLGKRDLKECRLVCKTWNVSTIPYTRKTSSITLYGKPPTYDNDKQDTGTIENFMEVFRSNQLGIPFARFKLGCFCTTDGVGQEFLQLCGDVIKEIEFVNQYYMIEDLSQILKSTPKLEIFEIPNVRSRSGNVVKLFPGPEDSKPKLNCLKTLNVIYDNREERNESCPTFLEELLTSAQNIIRFRILDFVLPSYSYNEEGGEQSEELNYGSSVEILSLIENLGRESAIQELHLVHEKRDDSEYIEILRKMSLKPDGLKLKLLHYEPASSDQKTLKLYQLVSLFKDTLEDLKIEESSSANFTDFLKMSHLVRLSIQLPDYFDSKFINLNEIFPVLKELGLFKLYGGQEFYEFFPESEPCLKINTFISDIVFYMEGFRPMLTVFPNLTKLALEVKEDGAEILREIWSQMKQLKYLKIGGNIHAEDCDSLDSVFTGISIDVLDEMEDVMKNLEKMETEVERGEAIMKLIDQHCQFPSIRNLTNLRSLDLDLTEADDAELYLGRTWICLTELTGYLAFYSMKHLRELKVKHCELRITCCEILTKALELDDTSTFEMTRWTSDGLKRNFIPDYTRGIWTEV